MSLPMPAGFLHIGNKRYDAVEKASLNYCEETFLFQRVSYVLMGSLITVIYSEDPLNKKIKARNAERFIYLSIDVLCASKIASLKKTELTFK